MATKVTRPSVRQTRPVGGQRIGQIKRLDIFLTPDEGSRFERIFKTRHIRSRVTLARELLFERIEQIEKQPPPAPYTGDSGLGAAGGTGRQKRKES